MTSVQPEHTEELIMRRALRLASQGLGQVSPNPMVGCVITCDGRIIGEGWHRRFGGPHAEVEALRAVQNPELLPTSTLYVNLEPCNHHGKTPPCTEAILASGIKRVVIANLDSNPNVAGQGVHRLREAGVEVRTGVLQAEGRQLNRRFFTSVRQQRPYLILKWAQTADGFFARSSGDSKWISHLTSRQKVHQWRSEEDAVLVGARTVQIDNPQLNVRLWSGRNPVRIVVDRFLRLSDSLHVFDGTQPTWVYNVLKHQEKPGVNYYQIDDQEFLESMFRDLWKRGIGSVLIEGGAALLELLIQKGLWDEARVFTAPQQFAAGLRAPQVGGVLHTAAISKEDKLEIYYPSQITSHG